MAVLTDVIAAAAAGFAGTKAMEQVASRLITLESEADQRREQEVRPGPPFVLAARNLADRVFGVDLDEDRQIKAGMARPITAGLATGASQSLLLDEIITPPWARALPTANAPWQSARPSPRHRNNP